MNHPIQTPRWFRMRGERHLKKPTVYDVATLEAAAILAGSPAEA
ncbi:MAG TPA: hypothetical protein VMG30_20885 [Acidobacteriota bacterium]|nr:hypothetical protein [Acidobacteriota bacterium]